MKSFWKSLSKAMEQKLGQKIPFSSCIYLFHDFSSVKLDRLTQQLLINLCVAASLLLASNWKSTEVPSKEKWLGKVRFVFLMSKLSALINYRQGDSLTFFHFKKIWAPFFQLYCNTRLHFVRIVSL